jgi:hypothetical protein
MNLDQIHFRAEFIIEEGKIKEFKKLVQGYEQSSRSQRTRYNKLQDLS